MLEPNLHTIAVNYNNFKTICLLYLAIFSCLKYGCCENSLYPLARYAADMARKDGTYREKLRELIETEVWAQMKTTPKQTEAIADKVVKHTVLQQHSLRTAALADATEADLRAILIETVQEAIASGASWTQISSAVGMSRQAIQQKIKAGVPTAHREQRDQRVKGAAPKAKA